MATTSKEYMQQIQNMGEMPNFQQQITEAYDQPVLRPIVNERANLEQQYLPTLFNTFKDQGTSASDMSPAAKLAMIGGNLGRLTSRIGANQDIQNFYGMQISNLANQAAQNWQNQYSKLRDLYGMAFQREEAERAEAARKAAAARSAAQSRARAFPNFPSFNGSSVNDLIERSRRLRESVSQRNRDIGTITQQPGRNFGLKTLGGIGGSLANLYR